jgi:hypothetical protein
MEAFLLCGGKGGITKYILVFCPSGLALCREFKIAPGNFAEPGFDIEGSNPSSFINKKGSTRDPFLFIWRRGRDSNPRYGYKPYTHFPGVLLQPLGHLSGKGFVLYRIVPASATGDL